MQLERLQEENNMLAERGKDSLVLGTQTDTLICPEVTNAAAHNLLSVTDELLNDKWLPDLTIQPYSQMLNDRFSEGKSGIIINPLVVHAMKNTDDFATLLDPFSIIKKDYVIPNK